MPDLPGRSASLWALLLFDPHGEFEMVLDVGTEQEMRDKERAYPVGTYRPEVALVHSSVSPPASSPSPS